jgi:hypothetical protein
MAALPAVAETEPQALCAGPDPNALAARLTLLIQPNRENVPTNAFLFRSTYVAISGWRARVHRSDEEPTAGAILEGAGGEGYQGQMELDPNARYVLDLWNFDDEETREPRLTLEFSTGDGEDEEPPDPPEIVDEFVSEVLPSGSYEGECGGMVSGRDAATSIEWEFSGERGTTALLFDLIESSDEPVDFGAIFHRGDEARGHLAFVTGEPGVREMGFVLEDVAGNRSEMLIVQGDFAGCGMCTQTSMVPSGFALLALKVLRRRWRLTRG